MTEEHARRLEIEMIEAKTAEMEYGDVSKDPLLLILWRLNHQDRTLEAIKADLFAVSKGLTDHVARNDVMQESIDEMVVMWKGSKAVGRIMTWGVGIAAAVGAAYATWKRGFS